MADVFISYAHENRELAAALAGKLSSRGYSVWWDHELVGGSEFREVIHRELRDSQYSMVIWTPQSIKSKWVIDEAEEAQRLGKLVPVKADSITDAELPLGMRGIQTLNISDMDGIIRAIRNLNIRRGVIGNRGFLGLMGLLFSRMSSLVNRYSYEYGLHIAICFVFLPALMDLIDRLPDSVFKKPFPGFSIWNAILVFFPALGWANLISRVLRRQHDHGIFLGLIVLSLILFFLYLFMPATGPWQWYSENYLHLLRGFLVAGAALWIYYFYKTLRAAIKGT